MKDEIKEILDRLKIKSDRYNHHLKYDEDYEASLLLDYITNLQKENKQLKETIKEATRILNSAKNHYGNDGKNWALERVIDLLGDKENE